MEPLEIERKYLLSPHLLKDPGFYHAEFKSIQGIRQGYLATSPWDVRVRLSTDLLNPLGLKQGSLTIKYGPGLVRTEVTRALSLTEISAILPNAQHVLDKRRYQVGRWEIDVYEGPHEGLWIAEIELRSETETVEFPTWLRPYVIAEVTFDARFKNAALAQSTNDIWTSYQPYTPAA